MIAYSICLRQHQVQPNFLLHIVPKLFLSKHNGDLNVIVLPIVLFLVFKYAILYGACGLVLASHASAVAQGNVVRAMSASYGKSLYSTLRGNQTP
jgi:hypothetical protein